MINVALAQKVLDHIEAHPESHSQSDFIHESKCGTVGCVAGWACVLSGDKYSLANRLWEGGPYSLDSGRSWFSRAIELLGLDFDPAVYLFYDTSNEEAVSCLKGLINGSFDISDHVVELGDE